MENKVITGAALLYYSENIEGEPLTQDVPLTCFNAGAQFVIDSQKKRNNCNIPDGISYKAIERRNKRIMGNMYKKIADNVDKIITVSGFYVTAPGDESVGIKSASWEICNDFHFDTPEDLEEYRKEIKQLFEFHCGEIVSVITFEEYRAELDAEDEELYKAHPVRYLIKYNGSYKQANSTASYGSSVGDGIHFELPHWIHPDTDNYDDKVIKSTSDEYWQILKQEAGRLEREISNDEYSLANARRNLNLIRNDLNHAK